MIIIFLTNFLPAFNCQRWDREEPRTQPPTSKYEQGKWKKRRKATRPGAPDGGKLLKPPGRIPSSRGNRAERWFSRAKGKGGGQEEQRLQGDGSAMQGKPQHNPLLGGGHFLETRPQEDCKKHCFGVFAARNWRILLAPQFGGEGRGKGAVLAQRKFYCASGSFVPIDWMLLFFHYFIDIQWTLVWGNDGWSGDLWILGAAVSSLSPAVSKHTGSTRTNNLELGAEKFANLLPILIWLSDRKQQLLVGCKG